jgi:mono/diheme cytochrome c family protein
VDGEKIRAWSAVNLTSVPSGLKAWSQADLAKYLHAGFSPRAGTFGPMNEVIANSTSQLPDDAIQAMAVYIKSLPQGGVEGAPVPAEAVAAGAGIYKDHCEKCHGSSGRGGMFMGPPLSGSAIVQQEDPASLINAVLYGAKPPKGITLGAWETMQPYADVLSDAQVASVANYVRGSWGNRAPQVDAAAVTRQR